MLKSYFQDLFKRLRDKSIVFKIIISLFILFEIFILVVSFVKVDYTITTPGYLMEASNTIILENDNERGHILTVSVTEYNKVSMIQYFLAKRENRVVVEEVDQDYSYEELNTYSVLSKKIAMYNAIIVGYEEAMKVNPEVNLIKNFKGMLVVLKQGSSDTSLEADDIITKVNGESFTNSEEFHALFNKLFTDENPDGALGEGDIVKFTILRNVKGQEVELEKTAKIFVNEDGKFAIGISVAEYTLPDSENSTPKFKISEDAYETIGGSGGAMMALSVYNGLVNDDITKIGDYEMIIAGTGTISSDGTVGAIGGIEQKVIKAGMSGVDLFFVDQYDYEDAIKACEKFGYDKNMIIRVEKFTDIIEALNQKRGENHE